MKSGATIPKDLLETGEMVIYQPDETTRLEVKVDGETVWLNRHQMARLFGRDIKTIGKHIKNALKEELKGMTVVANFATTAADGKTYSTEHYNLDLILAIGYRVKSPEGIIFRKWANDVLKQHLLSKHYFNHRIALIEDKLQDHENVLAIYGEKINFFIKTSLPPVEGVFYDGQIFDAYIFATDLIKSAKSRIILIDNYIDETVLTMLSKRCVGVDATIQTVAITQQFKLDLDKHNAQYPIIKITIRKNIHDRFLIIDNDIYHIGASLKDLGKKLFAFSKMGISPDMVL